MPNSIRSIVLISSLLLLSDHYASPAGETPEATAPAVPVVVLTDDCTVDEMLVIGAFPHPFDAARAAEARKAGGAVDRAGFDVDFLAKIGGEANPRLDALAEGAAVVDGYDAVAKRVSGGLTGWEKLFTPDVFAVAYGVVDIEADKAQTVTARFGSDDYAKVWVNGKLVHEVWKDDGREAWPNDLFSTDLRAGRNRFVVKVEQKHGGWGLNLALWSAEGAAAHQRVIAEDFKRRRFYDQPVFTTNQFGEYFGRRLVSVGPLPSLMFQNPELAAEMGDMDTFKVRWFDAALDEVAAAGDEGPYFGYVTLESREGPTIRRIVPVYALKDWQWYDSTRLFRGATFPWKKNIRPALPERAWNEHGALLSETAGEAWDQLAAQHDGVPLLLAEIALDRQPAGAWRESMYSNVHNHLVQLRRKALDRPAAKTLPPPADDPAATALRMPGERGLAEAGMKPDAAEKIRLACQAWRDATGLGFSVVVARRGVVVIHEAFPGEKDADRVDPDELKNGLVTVASRLPTASVTKLHAGVLLGRYIDQGWVDLDGPISAYFPDFPEDGPKRVTVRQLMNHMSGLTGHRYWFGLNGMVNPFLDNAAWWDLQRAAPGAIDQYNGFGADIAGKIIEDISGVSVFRAMREGLFEPLGQDQPTINDLGYGLNCTAMDLARVAEMLRQGGAYAGKRYFSRETLAKLLPRPYGDTNPDMKEERKTAENGVGISWMRDRIRTPEAMASPEWDNPPPEHYRFGLNVFGHGSATGAVLRVAPDHELVIAMTRYSAGDNYATHLDGFLKAIAESME